MRFWVQVLEEPAREEGVGADFAASQEPRSFRVPPGHAGLRSCHREGLSTLTWHLLSTACFLFVKDKLWYQNLPKIPSCPNPSVGVQGAEQKSHIWSRVAAQEKHCSALLCLAVLLHLYFSLLCSEARDLRYHP